MFIDDFMNCDVKYLIIFIIMTINDIASKTFFDFIIVEYLNIVEIFL